MTAKSLGVNKVCPRCRIFSYFPPGAAVCYHCLRKPDEAAAAVPVPQMLTGRPSMDELRKMIPAKAARRTRGAR